MNHKDYGISNEKFNDIKEMFKMYDKNGDGRISKGELMLTMQLIGANPTKDEVENMIREVDTDGQSLFFTLSVTFWVEIVFFFTIFL